jgi:hypothetical protein
MSITKGTVHGIASMILVVLGAMLADITKQNIKVYEQLSDLSVQLLIDSGNIPISEEVATIVIPVGVLMGIWVFIYEVKEFTN